MNKQEFIASINEVVVNDSIKSVESNLIKPPGRAPEEKLVILSSWFNNLRDTDRDMVMKVVKESVQTGVFSFLCVLDGVRAIEDGDKKGKLDLYYEKDEKLTLLNNQSDEYLHDLYNNTRWI